MKRGFILLALSSLVFLNFAEAAQKFPMISYLKGKVLVVDAKDHEKPAKNRQSLVERARIRTSADSLVLIQISARKKVYLGPESQLFLPVIAIEDGKIERLELEKGSMRLVNLTGDPEFVVTPLSHDPFQEADVVFEYNEKAPSLKWGLLEGHSRFRGLENEEFVELKRNETVTFQGEFKEQEIAYDLLLAGRKVARGKYLPKGKIFSNEKGSWWAETFDLEKKFKVEQVREAKERSRSGVICYKPSAKLNECAWICEGKSPSEKKSCPVEKAGVSCARYRCDANGVWADRFQLPSNQSRCQASPIVKACDY